ncbi:MAG: GNAT family N-acetyltransferase [Myxococcota bacterium]
MIRPLASPAELDLVAARMRATLVEVLGEARGGSMYTMDWLRERARWHVDHGAVLLADVDGAIAGHTIVREEPDGGLFSTTWVDPAWRRRAIGSALLLAGEGWMRARGLAAANTWTSSTNVPLIRLYERHGYAIVERGEEMVRLSRSLRGGHQEGARRRGGTEE